MPARDRYHGQVKNAQVKDGWTITDDPLHVKWGKNGIDYPGEEPPHVGQAFLPDRAEPSGRTA